MTDKALNLLQFAAKAGKLSYGTHATVWSIEKGSAKLVCTANDISEKTVKELKFKASKMGTPVLTLPNIDSGTMSQALGKSCGIVAVNDPSFSKAIIEKSNLGGTADDGKI